MDGPRATGRLGQILGSGKQAFRAVFEHASFGMTIVDSRGGGRLIDANPALAQMLGYDCPTLRRMSFPDFTHPDDIEPNMHLYREALENKRDHYEMDKRYIRRDGGLVWVRLAGAVVRNPVGEADFLVGMIQDVSELKRAQARAERSELRGIVPLCSFCKSIRDEAGEWNRLEKYIEERTEARFSHGICPACRVKHPGMT